MDIHKNNISHHNVHFLIKDQIKMINNYQFLSIHKNYLNLKSIPFYTYNINYYFKQYNFYLFNIKYTHHIKYL